jgi:SAM-dependent methyltransferase
MMQEQPEVLQRKSDRTVLERVIFPFVIENFKPETILDIGRTQAQQHYNDFFKGKDFWTIDIDPENKKFGAKNHVVDDVQHLSDHFEENKFDLIIFNGVIGWGLNKKQEVEKGVKEIHKVLKKGGLLIVGWNNVPDLMPVHLDEVCVPEKFEKHTLKPLEAHNFATRWKHTFSFFTKK